MTKKSWKSIAMVTLFALAGSTMLGGCALLDLLGGLGG